MNIRRLHAFYVLAQKSVNAWVDDYAPSMGAAISYYTVFSIAPLLIIVIAVAGFVWGREAVQGEIIGQLTGLIGREGAIGVQALIESANKPAQGIVATAISVGVLVVGATTVFAELQSAMDRIWDVPPSEKASGIWATLRARLLSLGFILGLGFLLMVSLVISAGVAAFGTWTTGLVPGAEVLLQVINTLVSLGISALLFGLIFKLMPQAKVSWRDVWVGAAVTSVLFEVGKMLIGLYIGKSSVTSSFAAAGSLVVLLVWVYYSAQIFLLGAEFTWVYAHDHGSLAKADDSAKAAANANGVLDEAPEQAAATRADIINATRNPSTARADIINATRNPSTARVEIEGAVAEAALKARQAAVKAANATNAAALPSDSPRQSTPSTGPATSPENGLMAAPRCEAGQATPPAVQPASAADKAVQVPGKSTFRQRAIVYGASGIAYLAISLLLKKHDRKARPARQAER